MPPVDPIDPSNPQYQGIAKANDTIAERSSKKVAKQNVDDALNASTPFAFSDVVSAARLFLPTSVGQGPAVAGTAFNIEQITPYDLA